FSGNTTAAVVGVAGGSELTVTAGIDGASSLTKLGAGTLAFDGRLGTETTAVTVGTGTLRVGPTPDLSHATLTVLGGATFDLAGNSKLVNGLLGGGTVALGSGTLTVGRPGLRTGAGPDPAGGAFAGVIGGSGGLSLQAPVGRANALT